MKNTVVKLSKGNKEFEDMLMGLSVDSPEIAAKAVYKGAGIVASSIKVNIPVKTGGLKKSLGIAKIKKTYNGAETIIGFSGYDQKGVANVLKARVLESGSSKQAKKPFFRPAVNKSKGIAEKAMADVIDEEIKKRS